MILYSYFRSSAAYRVRIALNIKGIEYELRPVNLLEGAQREAGYLDANPQGLVPALQLDDGTRLTQSMAICEYLDEVQPEPPLLPGDAAARARVRALAQIVGADTHPLNNLRVLNYLTGELEVTDDQRLAWIREWIARGFGAVEALLAGPATGNFCHGNAPTLSDIFLVPQVFNARRFDCDLSPYPRLVEIADRCGTLDAFARAAPENQPDAPG